MVKAVVCDLDGSLLNHRHVLSKRSIQMIHTLAEQGIEFMIATGRDFESAMVLFEGVKVPFMKILLNGAMVCDTQNTIISMKAIPNEEVRKIAEIFESYKIAWNIYTPKGAASFCTKEELLESFKDASLLNFVSEEDVQEFSHYFDGLQYYPSCEKMLEEEKEILKIECNDSRLDVLQEIKEKLKQFTDLDIVSSFSLNIEITSKKATKGNALADILMKFGIAEDEVLVFGDSENDLSMLNYPKAYAMANADAMIKQKATCILPYTNAEDGIAKFVEEVVLRK